MTQKEFLKEYKHLKISIQYLDIFDGCYKIQVYNTYYQSFPVFEHIIPEFDMDNLKVDFDTVITTPILNWLQETGEY
jgi:hypothetical protein